MELPHRVISESLRTSISNQSSHWLLEETGCCWRLGNWTIYALILKVSQNAKVLVCFFLDIKLAVKVAAVLELLFKFSGGKNTTTIFRYNVEVSQITKPENRICSWPLTRTALNCLGPLEHGYFSLADTTVPHGPWLAESVDTQNHGYASQLLSYTQVNSLHC